MASTFALHGGGAAFQGRPLRSTAVRSTAVRAAAVRSAAVRPTAVRPTVVRPGRDRAGRRARRLTLPSALVGMGLALLPWMCLLAAQGEWPWVGLDVLEATGLVATGLLLRRADTRAAFTAAATAALLLTDAWFDVTTSHGADLVQAWVLALLLELPIAALCGRLALRTR